MSKLFIAIKESSIGYIYSEGGTAKIKKGDIFIKEIIGRTANYKHVRIGKTIPFSHIPVWEMEELMLLDTRLPRVLYE